MSRPGIPGPQAGEDANIAPGKPRTFRSPFTVVIWWLWLLFAAGNLIDIAVQGRDHLSLVATFILLLVTGVMYATAQRPRIVTDDAGLTIRNPLRDHRLGWAAVAGIDPTELVRVRCEWPLGDGDDGAGGTGKRVIYCWAVHSSRRRQAVAKLRSERRSRRRPAAGPFGSFGAPPASQPAPAPTAADPEHVVSELTALAEQAREAAPQQRAVPPVSTWSWRPFAAILVPAAGLLIATLA